MVNPRLMVWLKGLAAAAVLTVALGGTPSFAQSGEEAAHAEPGVEQETGVHDEKGLPQLNAKTFPSQIFWLALTFGTLYLLVAKVGLPRVGAVLEAREAKISGDLDKATQLKAETDAIVAAYEKAVAEARAGAQKLLNETAVAADAAAAQRTADIAAGLAAKQKEAEARIEGQKQTALANVRAVAAEAAAAAVIKLAGVEPDQAGVDGAVDAALKERA